MNAYDSQKDTLEHIEIVRQNLNLVIADLANRATVHDESKLSGFEKEAFDRTAPLLKTLIYGTDEYRQTLKQIKPAIEAHYKANDHHPEHFENGIRDMNLLQLIEMLCDWKAATLRMKDGDLRLSIKTNGQRFGYDENMENLLLKTAEYLGFI